MPARRAFKRTMVIVCEDSVVTPGYLKNIRKQALENGIWSDIDIFPVPPPDVTTVKNDNPDKTPRLKRTFRVQTEDIQFEVEEKYKAQPTRYVREAQLRATERGHEEAWAVYDLDGHARHEEAYDLAKTDPKILLGFNSIAVEHWFLLHFVRDDNAYTKARLVPVGNYIQGYEKGKTSGEDIFEMVNTNLSIALENAAWLREKNAGKTGRCYQINPYINMDLLIKSMLSLQETLIWGTFGVNVAIRKIDFLLTRDNHLVTIAVANKSSAGIFLRHIFIYSLDADRNDYKYAISDMLVEPGHATTFDLEIEGAQLLNILYENHRIIFEV